MDLGLKDKVAIVTGTNNPLGIGAATALALADEGVKVAMIFKRVKLGINPMKNITFVSESYKEKIAGNAYETEMALKAKGLPFMSIEADIADENAITNCYDAIEAELGPVEILVNNAALYADEDNILMVSNVDFDTVYAVNVKGLTFMIREFVTRHIDRQANFGRIINLSTYAAHFLTNQLVYSSSKAAVEAITSAVSLEVAHLGITVNAVAPGPTQTGWLDLFAEQAILRNIPLGRIGKPEDIASAILFLASNKASWITGQVVSVAGGHAL